METFVGSKKNKIWLWTAVDHFKPGILGWVLGDHSAETFEPLWAIAWHYYYITDGWSVYHGFIRGDQIVSKTYMTRVEEKYPITTLPRSVYARLFVIPSPVESAGTSIQLLLHCLKFTDVPVLSDSSFISAWFNYLIVMNQATKPLLFFRIKRFIYYLFSRKVTEEGIN